MKSISYLMASIAVCCLLLLSNALLIVAIGQPASHLPQGNLRRKGRRLQEFRTLCKALDNVPTTCAAEEVQPSCYAAKSPAYCKEEHSFDALIAARTKEAQTNSAGLLAAGYWAHLLEDKGAGYIHSVQQGFAPPNIYCCVTDPNDIGTDTDCTNALAGPVVIKAVDGHSNVGVFAFESGVSFGVNSIEMLTDTGMTLEDVLASLQAQNPSKIILEELVVDATNDLPTEYKFHMFNGEVGAVDIIMNRGTDCACYAVIDMECNRLDQQGCFETQGGEATDGAGCTALNSALGMYKAGPVKRDLPICGDIDPNPCLLAKLEEVAKAVSQTIGVYIRVDMFADTSDNVVLQEYSTNHMGGFRYCASRMDPDTSCLDVCYLGEMWDNNGLNKLHGGDSTALPSYLSSWTSLSAEDQCALIEATPVNNTFTSTIITCTAKPSDAPTASPVGGFTNLPPTTAPTTSPTGSPTSAPPTTTLTSPATISGVVLMDNDGVGDGVEETPAAGEPIMLLDESNAVVATTTTASNGSYDFPAVPPGTYTMLPMLTKSFSFSNTGAILLHPNPDPTASPTSARTGDPTASPTTSPTTSPTFSPTATPTMAPTAWPSASPTGSPTSLFLLIDEDSIDNNYHVNKNDNRNDPVGIKVNGTEFFTDIDVNEQMPGKEQRAVLRYFQDNPGETITLRTGQTGDEGWFAPTCIPGKWMTGNTTHSECLQGADQATELANFMGMNGQGAIQDQSLLDKIPYVIPLRALGLKMLEGKDVCALVYDSDISINYNNGTDIGIDGNLQGETLGVAAFHVDKVWQLDGFSSSTLPQVTLTIIDASQVCGNVLPGEVPIPETSSEPVDNKIPASALGYRWVPSRRRRLSDIINANPQPE